MYAVGLLVAVLIFPADDPTRLDVVYFSDQQIAGDNYSPVEISLHSDDTAITFPGRYQLHTVAPDGQATELEVELAGSKNAASYRIRVSAEGEVLAQGLALPDPDNPRKLLVSGWTGTIEPYGVAKYSIVDTQTINGYYISKMTPDHPGQDMVSGDTSQGFEGEFTLNSKEVNGRTWGPHQWILARKGEITYLRWVEDGKVISRGFGIADPEDAKAIVVTYIPVDG